MGGPESKPCVVCGRTIEWRKKWERNWPEVKYCSDACRRHRLTDVDAALEAVILDLLDRRALGATICPSDAARAVGGADDGEWITGGDADNGLWLWRKDEGKPWWFNTAAHAGPVHAVVLTPDVAEEEGGDTEEAAPEEGADPGEGEGG